MTAAVISLDKVRRARASKPSLLEPLS